jgi:hypothetical protein
MQIQPITPINPSTQTNKDGDKYTPSKQPIGAGLYPDRPENIVVRSEAEKVKKALDVQIGGNHYKRFKIQPAEFCISNGIGFGEGNVIKYVCRHSFKNGLEDLKKAKHYIDLIIQLEYGDENQRLQAEQEMRNLCQEDDK